MTTAVTTASTLCPRSPAPARAHALISGLIPGLVLGLTLGLASGLGAATSAAAQDGGADEAGGAAPTDARAAERLALYRAQVGAAEAVLRLDETTRARDWLSESPRELRGWEWRWLHARTDESLKAWPVHDGEIVYGLRVSRDGERILTAGFDQKARLRDARTGELVATFEGHERPLWSAALHPDGDRVLTASGDSTARLFDAASGEQVEVLWKSDVPVSSSDTSPGGMLFAASSYELVEDGPELEGIVRLFDTKTLEEVRTLRGGSKPISLIRFSPDGARLAASCWDATVQVWDVATGERQLELTVQDPELYSAADCVAWSPDGRLLAAGTKAGEIRLFDMVEGVPVGSFYGHTGFVGGVAFHPRRAVLASAGEDGTVRFWKLSDGSPVAVLHGHTAYVRGLEFSPDGRRLYSASEDGTIRVWEGTPEALLRQKGLEIEAGYTLSFSSDGRVLACSTYYGKVRLWDVDASAPLVELNVDGPSLNVCAFAPDDRRLAVGRADGAAFLLDTDTGEVLAEYGAHRTGVSGVAWRWDGRRVAIGHYDDVVRVVNAETGEPLWQTEKSDGRGAGLGGLSYDPSGRELVVPFDESLRILDGETGDLRAQFAVEEGRVLSTVWTDDGERVLATTTTGHVGCWRVKDGELLWWHKGHGSRGDRVRLSPDGTRAVTTGNDLVVWDIATGQALLRTRPHPAGMYDAAFHPSGDILATLGTDDRMLLLDAVPRRVRLGFVAEDEDGR